MDELGYESRSRDFGKPPRQATPFRPDDPLVQSQTDPKIPGTTSREPGYKTEVPIVDLGTRAVATEESSFSIELLSDLDTIGSTADPQIIRNQRE